MRLSRNAIGNLIARYSAILKKCAVINVLAAGLLLGGMHGVAGADVNITTADELGDFLQGDDANGIVVPDEISGVTGKSMGGLLIRRVLTSKAMCCPASVPTLSTSA